MKFLRMALALGAFVTLTSCATMKLNPPSVSIAEVVVGELTEAGRSYTVEFLVRNPNREELPLTRVSFELALGDSEVMRIEQALDLNAAPFGTERVHLDLDGRSDGPARALAAAAQRGRSLSYRSSGYFVTPLAEDPIRFARRGELHPSPGVPGKFRAGN